MDAPGTRASMRGVGPVATFEKGRSGANDTTPAHTSRASFSGVNGSRRIDPACHSTSSSSAFPVRGQRRGPSGRPTKDRGGYDALETG